MFILKNWHARIRLKEELHFVLAVSVISFVVGPTTLLSQVRATDWRIYGTFTSEGVLDLLFYDAANVVQPMTGRFNVSVKGLSAPQIDLIEANETMRNSLVERAVAKAKLGATIPPWVAKGLSGEQAFNLMVAQETANAGGVDPMLRGTYEIDCTQRVVRVLAFSFAQGDKSESYERPGGWQSVTPHSNKDMLLMSICSLFVPKP